MGPIKFKFQKNTGIILLVFTVLMAGCMATMQDTENRLTPLEFSEKLKLFPHAPLIDVRTPEEFSKERLQNAVNIDWSRADFENQVAVYPKNKPVFLYCMSGARSSMAAAKMRKNGFKEVYELKGGLMKWREAGFPVVKDNKKSFSMITVNHMHANTLLHKIF